MKTLILFLYAALGSICTHFYYAFNTEQVKAPAESLQPCPCADITPDHPDDGNSFIIPQWNQSDGKGNWSNTIWYNSVNKELTVMTDTGICRFYFDKFWRSAKIPVYYDTAAFRKAVGSKIFSRHKPTL